MAKRNRDNQWTRQVEALEEELRHYRRKRDRIRDLVGQIGGKNRKRRMMVINAVFLVLVLACFLTDALQYAFGFEIKFLPPLFLLELAVLLVSLKIVWMIHQSTRVEHFQFWILNSIEYRLDQINRRTKSLEKKISDLEPQSSQD